MQKALNKIYRTIMISIIVSGLVFIVLRLMGVVVLVQGKGPSMEPTYKSGECHWMLKTGKYERDDVISIRLDDGRVIMKRIIATEGDTVEIYHHCVFVNNILVEPYIKGENWNGSGEFDMCLIIGQNEFFVLGDNRNESFDSRYSEMGPVRKEQIQGEIITWTIN